MISSPAGSAAASCQAGMLSRGAERDPSDGMRRLAFADRPLDLGG